MIPANVTLIVKAPNQQIEDQNVECLSSWTVRQLKGHLSEVYPSKPKTEEQKIIYSGQLLDDNTILKDVLRTYETEIAHTMHLVCTPNKRMTVPPKTTPQPEPNTDGLRQRNVPPTNQQNTPPVEPRPEMRQNDQNHTVEMQNYLSSFVNNYGRVPPYPNYNFGLPVPSDPAQLANHMMMMQQAYVQYMQQYANMWQATATATAAAAPAPPAEAPPPPPPADEAEEHYDWLDSVYTASRLAILFFLVYLYGSPARLLLVLLLAAAGYLHQIGFFRELHVNAAAEPREQPAANAERNQNQENNPQENQANANQGNPNQVNANHVNPNQVNANQGNPNQVNANQGNPNQVNVNQGNAQPQEPAPVINADNQQSLLAVGWMIFTSFFASLIPEAN